MELETLFGLPAHPLFVHAAVVLVPLAALATLVVAFVPRARQHYAPIALALAVVGFVSLGLTQGSGEALEHNVVETDLVEAHAEQGESALPFAIGIVVAAAGIAALGLIERKAPRVPQKALVLGLGALAVVSSVGGIYKIVEIGHSGAKAAWSDVTFDGTESDHDHDDGDHEDDDHDD